MKILGLTGPTGSGKSVVGQALSARGIPVLDADAVYHGWIDKPTPCTEELASAFGKGILAPDGSIDRQCLSAIVFSGDAEEKGRLQMLNRITHRYVLDGCRAWLAEQEKAGLRAVAIDAPLLIEAGLHRSCDHVITVLAPRDVRLARIMARDGISRDRAEARVSAQKSDEFYRDHADFVFLNDGSPIDAERFAEDFISKILPQQNTFKE